MSGITEIGNYIGQYHKVSYLLDSKKCYKCSTHRVNKLLHALSTPKVHLVDTGKCISIRAGEGSCQKIFN